MVGVSCGRCVVRTHQDQLAPDELAPRPMAPLQYPQFFPIYAFTQRRFGPVCQQETLAQGSPPLPEAGHIREDGARRIPQIRKTRAPRGAALQDTLHCSTHCVPQIRKTRVDTLHWARLQCSPPPAHVVAKLGRHMHRAVRPFDPRSPCVHHPVRIDDVPPAAEVGEVPGYHPLKAVEVRHCGGHTPSGQGRHGRQQHDSVAQSHTSPALPRADFHQTTLGVDYESDSGYRLPGPQRLPSRV